MIGKKVASTKAPVKVFKRTEHDGKKSGGIVKIKWAVSTNRRSRRPKDAACLRSRICSLRQARESAKCALAEAWGRSSARPRALETRVRSRDAAIRVGAVLKADRCRCTGACRSAGFIIRLA